MCERLFTPNDVAARLGIRLSTLGLWCVLFGECLSASAGQPDLVETGLEERLFTEEDVALLSGAKKLLSTPVTSSPRDRHGAD